MYSSNFQTELDIVYKIVMLSATLGGGVWAVMKIGRFLGGIQQLLKGITQEDIPHIREELRSLRDDFTDFIIGDKAPFVYASRVLTAADIKEGLRHGQITLSDSGGSASDPRNERLGTGV
jgi:hypothetical protein